MIVVTGATGAVGGAWLEITGRRPRTIRELLERFRDQLLVGARPGGSRGAIHD